MNNKETDSNSPKRFSRRRFLQLSGAVAVVGTGLFLLESNKVLKTSTIANNLQPPPFPTPTPEKYVIGVPGVTRTELEKVPVAADLVELKDRLAGEIDAHEGQTAVAVTDVKTGEMIDVNGDRIQLTGCVANLFCALTVIEYIRRGLITKEEVEYDLTTMVRHSSPSHATPLLNQLGNGDVEKALIIINDLMRSWGLEKSIYANPPALDDCYEDCRRPNEATANEINQILVKIAKNELFPADQNFDANQYAIWVMSNNKPGLNFMIPWEIPQSEATVAHKVGWYPGQPHTINDVGLVFASDQRFQYAISCLYQNYDYSMAEETLYYDPGGLLSRLSKITYQTFVNRYGRP